MASPVLDPSMVVDVIINVSPTAVANETFNQGLMISNSTVIPNATRLLPFQNPAQVLAYGFSSSSPEYLASVKYFEQSPAATVGWIGLQDTTAILSASINAAGSGYSVGELITAVKSGGSGATYQVGTINGTGGVTSINQVTQGTGYTLGAATTTANGAGSGLTLTISSVGETPLQAILACRAASSAWYPVVSLTATTADHIAIAPIIEALTPKTMYLYATQDADALAGTAGNVFLTLQGQKYSRSYGRYSPDSYAVCRDMGIMCGLATGLANSAFTMMFKQPVGETPAPLTFSQVQQIAGDPQLGTFGQGGNVYVTFNGEFQILMQGQMANGFFLDQILYRDMLANSFQTQVMNLLIQSPKIPLTDSGVTQIIHELNGICANFVSMGYIAQTAVWEGVQILNLNNGDTMPQGFVIQAPKVSTLSSANRSARQSPPIYVSYVEAGAIQSVTIAVYPHV